MFQAGPWVPGVPPAVPGGAPPPLSGYGMPPPGGAPYLGQPPMPTTGNFIGVVNFCTLLLFSVKTKLSRYMTLTGL